VSDELTSVLSAVSEKGRPLRVKRAAKTRETRGQFRRIQVANSREIRWRKPVKSATEVVTQAVFSFPARTNRVITTGSQLALFSRCSIRPGAGTSESSERHRSTVTSRTTGGRSPRGGATKPRRAKHRPTDSRPATQSGTCRRETSSRPPCPRRKFWQCLNLPEGVLDERANPLSQRMVRGRSASQQCSHEPDEKPMSQHNLPGFRHAEISRRWRGPARPLPSQ